MAGSPPSNIPTPLSRKQLHELAWQTPMMHLASQFGISGNGLAKICGRLEIPVPPRGYWAKKAAGKKVLIAPLPPAGSDVPQSVKISPTPVHSENDQSPRAAAERLASSIEIRVRERLTKPHPIIVEWWAHHDRRKREAKQISDRWLREIRTPAPYTGIDRRRHRILHALFRELEDRGASIIEDADGTLYVELEEQKIEFAIREKLKQVRRPLTEKEKQWETWNKDGTKTELDGTGNLLFAIKSYLVGNLRKEWLEKPTKPLETALPEIVATFLTAAPLLKERATRRAEEAERHAAEQRRRDEERRLQKENDNRLRRLVEISSAWREFEIARSFLDALEQGHYDPKDVVGERTIAEWIKWARDEIEERDPLNRGAGPVMEDLARVSSWTYRD